MKEFIIMANKARRLLDNLKEQDKELIIKKIGDIDEKATPLKQARYINNCLYLAEDQDIDMK